MTEMSLLSSKDNRQQPEGMKENILGGLPCKQRSCAAVNAPATCVHKAIHHIQDLEVKVEESFQQYDHLYKLEKIPWKSDIKISSELKAKQSLYWEDIQPLKQKTTAVLAEVTELVMRLEEERKRAADALKFEENRRKKLYLNADILSRWRLEELPIAVQREWEKCSRDISELQWHFEEKNNQLQDAVNQLTKIDVANAKVLENITYMKKYSPLLGEKLFYEGDAMVEVKKIYTQTKTGYDVVHEELEMVNSLHLGLTEECERERKYMAEQIQIAEELLMSLQNELKDAEFIANDFSYKLKAKMEAVSHSKKLLEELNMKEAKTKANLTSWQDKVRRMTLKIATQENENKGLMNEYLEEKNILETSQANKKSDLSNMKKRLRTLLDEILETQSENKRLYDENGKFAQKFRESSRKRMAYQSEIQVLKKNIRRLEDHLKKVNKELYSAELAYDEARSKLEEVEQSLVKEKTRFKNLVDNVRKEIRDEVSAWKLTQKRVKALRTDLEKKSKEFEKLQEKVEKKLADLDKLVAEQEALFKKNDEAQKAYSKKIIQLNEQLQKLDGREAKKLEELEAQKKHFQTLLNDAQVKYLDISLQLDEVNKNIVKFQDEMNKVAEMSIVKEKQLAGIEVKVTVLREKYARIKAKEQNIQTLVDFLHERLDYTEKKIKTNNTAFEECIWKRQKALRENEVYLEFSEDENLRLAQEYQMLQLCYLNVKNELADFYDHKVRAESGLRDQQQLSRLQRKLHRVLVEYFKQRAVYSQAGLAKFQAASRENFQKILAVQGALSNTVQDTGTFLKSLTDGSST
ncbi:coiled-coil domain-containing protein 178 [Zootoca vivipara]|uniref:coiled-coil domain-containing protein 178 n=1 Tax=Zootoca vivipara TaxID=8524 RepID=UPI00293BFD7F|nr:coiled-coil domain-containing protein 178 [Zootoca vivipara]